MADQFENKIKRLELENFTCFGKVAMDFSPGINVFIGENGTGKTHLLKVMHVLRGGEFKYPYSYESDESLALNNFIESRFLDTFRTSDLDMLVKSTSKKKNFRVVIETPSNHLIKGLVSYSEYLFIPAFELLSWFNGFISAYENRESAIDETYYDLAKALDLLPLKGEKLSKQKPLITELEQAVQVKVIRKGNEFFLASINKDQEFPASLSASGINKLAQLIYLILNGSLTKDTILFWDEPEANLNPKYIVIVAKFLQSLANAGCQIFVATHDYILPYELSLSAEYKDVSETPVPDMKFFSLYKGENGTEVEEGATMSDLSHDAIHEGLTLHQDKEDRLFQKSLNVNP